MKKALSLFLSMALLLCTLPSVFISAEETGTDGLFTVDPDHAATTVISGDEVNGTTFTLTGEGRTRIMTKSAYPISTLSFDYGYIYSNDKYGEFGISKTGEISSVDAGWSGKDTLTFFYRIAREQLIISVRWGNLQEKTIGIFNADEHRKGDTYWSVNVSNFSFVKVDEHWHLSVDGNICNNVAENFDYSCLEYMLGKDTFENNESVYLYFGGYNSGTGYFKQLSVISEDKAWESRAVDSFKYSYNNAEREYRGQGNRDSTVHSKIPAAAVGNENDGYVIDFTGTDGYAQTADAYDLKTTTFYFAPLTYEGNKNHLWYYFGFTANPSVIQYHSQKPCDTVEFRAVSVHQNNQTEGYVVTNQSGCLANPDKEYLGKVLQWRTHRYEADDYRTTAANIKFVQDTGVDGETHWYMQTKVSGSVITVKSNNADTDKYLQFDSIIDKPVYFRVGTDGMNTDTSFKMYAKVAGTRVVTDNTLNYNIADEGFGITWEGGATVNGEQLEKGAVLDRVGEYTVKYTVDSVMHNRRLVLYKPGDVNADNGTDLLDLILLKKITAKTATPGTVGKQAADVDGNGKTDAADIAALRKNLLFK